MTTPVINRRKTMALIVERYCIALSDPEADPIGLRL